MSAELLILLFVSDGALRSSLEFALHVEGLPATGRAEVGQATNAAAVVLDQGSVTQSLAFLAELRRLGCAAHPIVLATHPTNLERAQIAGLGAVLIEKPLLGDELTRALRAALACQEAA